MKNALVTETGESFLTHAQLIRHIREKCGDSVADYVAQFLGEDREIANIDFLKSVRARLDEMSSYIRDADYAASEAVDMLEKAGAV